jgi:protein-disulfide isomerase
MRLKWDGILTVVLVLCALITTGVVVYRQFATPTSAAAQTAAEKPIFIQNWRSQLRHGVRVGSESAQVQLMEFSDFECPFCASFHKDLKALLQRYPTQVSAVYVHLPLEMHRFAVPAARVAECAGEQGRFMQMQDRLFAEQQSFGLKPWSDYAAAAGVPDLVSFDTCIKSSASITRVEAGKKLADELNINGTPTVIVNGWQLPRPPTPEQLDKMVKAVLSGKPPVSST